MPIDLILNLYDKLDNDGFCHILVEPDITVIEDDLRKAEEAYYTRRNLGDLVK